MNKTTYNIDSYCIHCGKETPTLIKNIINGIKIKEGLEMRAEGCCEICGSYICRVFIED